LKLLYHFDRKYFRAADKRQSSGASATALSSEVPRSILNIALHSSDTTGRPILDAGKAARMPRKLAGFADPSADPYHQCPWRSKRSDCSFARPAKKYRLAQISGAKEPLVDWEVNAGWTFCRMTPSSRGKSA
jgi:hypothetical protein